MAPWLPSLQFLRWVSHNLLWRPPLLRHPPSAPAFRRTTTSVPRNTTTCASPSIAATLQPLALLTDTKVVRSSSRSSVDSLCNSRLFKLRFTAWDVQPPLHLLLAQRPLLPHPVLPHRFCCVKKKKKRGPPPVVQCWSSSCSLPPCHSASTSLCSIRLCSRRGCTSPVPPLCSTGSL